jgi:hypothetical protein
VLTAGCVVSLAQLLDGRVGMLVVVPSGDDGAEIGLRVVTGTKGKRSDECAPPDYKGCIVARRAIRFLPHTKLTVPVTMRASCKDVPCGGAAFSTCVKGQCVDASVARLALRG